MGARAAATLRVLEPTSFHWKVPDTHPNNWPTSNPAPTSAGNLQAIGLSIDSTASLRFSHAAKVCEPSSDPLTHEFRALQMEEVAGRWNAFKAASAWKQPGWH